jgi:hypothetical protein
MLISEKFFFSRISKPTSIKLDTNHPCMEGVQVWSNRGPDLHQRGVNHKNANIRWSFKNLLKNHWARKAQIYKKAS